MVKHFLALVCLVTAAMTAQAQTKMKFGVHIDPTISFMGSNEKAVESDGAKMAFRFGVQGDIYFSESQKYALTVGTGFLAGVGGTLNFRDGGRLLTRADLDKGSFINAAGQRPTSGENMNFAAGTSIRYGVNYVPVSFGFKLTTEELGESFLRAFFHLPVIEVLIPVSASAKIEANGNILDDSYNTDGVYTGMFNGESAGENIYKEIFPVNLSAGVGAGVEWSPNDNNGIRLIGGIYYNTGVFDMTKKVGLYDPLDVTAPTEARYKEKNPRNAFQTISLRIGVIF